MLNYIADIKLPWKRLQYAQYRPDKYAAMCVDARQELDLKIGVAFSRLMTKAYLDMAREKFRLRDQKVKFFEVDCKT